MAGTTKLSVGIVDATRRTRVGKGALHRIVPARSDRFEPLGLRIAQGQRRRGCAGRNRSGGRFVIGAVGWALRSVR